MIRFAKCVFVVPLLLGGCNDAADQAPSDKPPPNAPATTAGRADRIGADPEVPQDQIAAWLATDLPPLAEGAAEPQVKLFDPQLTMNEFGQETLKIKYERSVVVRTLAADLSIVLLPVSGGRVTVLVNPAVLIQPQNSGNLFGIVQNMLDHRGRPRTGMRAYLEMHAASINLAPKKAERVSNVIWIGTDKQLAAAVRKGPPKAAGSASPPEPQLDDIPAGKIAKGTPLWMRCGDRWIRGHAAEDADGERIKLLIYLVRRDKPYLPWSVELPGKELRIDREALEEYQRDPGSFRDLADANDKKLARHGAPNKLEPVDPANLKVGTPVLDFWNGMLDPCRTTGEVKDGNVAIQRVGLDNAKMNKPAVGLFLDPFGEPAK